jgi:hypothetical protein
MRIVLLLPGTPPALRATSPEWHSRQPKESEIDFARRIKIDKRIEVSKLSSFIIISPPFEGGVAATQ